MRYAGVGIPGTLAGMGGFDYALATANCASTGEVAGFGFLAPAAMLFGLFKCIAVVYSSIDINGDEIYIRTETEISPYVYRLLQYLITLIALAFTSKGFRVPKAEGFPYDKGKR